MASLVGQQLKDTYDSLLKTSDNDALGGTYKEITDGSGNGSNLYLGTGGNVGIGGSPSVPLEITGSSSTMLGFNRNSGASDVSVRFKTNTGSPDGTFLNGGGPLALFRFYTESTERMRIGSGGDISFRDTSTNEAFYWDASTARLGLGTTSPSAGLHVEQSGTDVSIISRNTNNNASVATSSSLKLGITSTVGTHDGEIKVVEGAVNSNTTRMEFYNQFSGTSYKNMQILGNGDITFYDDTGVTPALFWDASAESLGIGTTSPAVELDVDGEIRAGSGILFGTDTATANALDDYEEGTFDATIYEVGGSDIIASTGDYVKIGSLVHMQVRILGGSAGGAGVVRMDLPFTQTSKGGANIVAYSASNGGIVSAFCIEGNDYLEFVDTIGAIASGNKSIGSDWSASSRLYFNFTYTTL